MLSYSDALTDPYGNAIDGAEILVKTVSDDQSATIFSDNAGTALANPLSTDDKGMFEFYAANGVYSITITAPGIPTKIISPIVLYDPRSALAFADFMDDFVVTGLLATQDSLLAATTAIGTAYIQGERVVMPATTKAYTASKDTYVDLNDKGTYTYVEVTNGAAAPAVTTNSIRLFKVVTDATTITSVTDLRDRDANLSTESGIAIGGGTPIKKIVRAAGSLDFGSIVSQTSADLTIACAGAVAGSPTKLGLSAAPNAGLSLTAFCVTNDIVTVRAANCTAGAIDPAAITVDVEVSNY